MENTLVRKMLKSALSTAVSVREMDFASEGLRKSNNKVVTDLNNIFTEKVNPATGLKEFYLNGEERG
jgi:hypothetical protein